MVIASIILTTALVLITGYYARQTRKTVEEMQLARRLSIAPRLVVNIDWTTRGPGAALTELRNAGLGPALDVDVTITFVGRDQPIGDADRLWRTAVLMPGEVHRFWPPNVDGHVLGADQFAQIIRSIRLTGSMEDGLGNVLTIDQTIEDVHQVWEMEQVASRQIPRDPTVEAIHDVARTIETAISKVTPIFGKGIVIADAGNPKNVAAIKPAPKNEELTSDSVSSAIRRFIQRIAEQLR